MLPDDILLEIFALYVLGGHFLPFVKRNVEKWITLAHVCRRWRSIVFQSPRRLNLRLVCTPQTPARDTLDIWPPLSLIIRDPSGISDDEDKKTSVDNITTALEPNDRVCQIELLNLTYSELEYVMDSAAIREPFPELTDLHLAMFVDDGPGPIPPAPFLGRTTPSLRSLYLDGIPFPELPKLLLSATHLVKLDLSNIPRSGHIPPEVMATSLSALNSLESLSLKFRYPQRHPASESQRPLPPSLTRSFLLNLTRIIFKGESEYLEEILARIDAPRLDKLDITFFNQIIFDTPQLFQFISRRPTLRAPKRCYIEFSSEAIVVNVPSQTSDNGVLSVRIPCTTSEWQLSSLEQVCTSSLPPISTFEDLLIFENLYPRPHWQDDIESTLWLELLHSFVAVKNLCLSEELAHCIAPALQELVGGRTTEVLPSLEKIVLDSSHLPSGPLHEGIEKFVAARRLTSHPVAVYRWGKLWEI